MTDNFFVTQTLLDLQPSGVKNQDFFVDAILDQNLVNFDWKVDATLFATFDNDFLVDAIIVTPQSKIFDVDAQIVQQQINNDFLVDAILLFSFEFTVDAQLAGQQFFVLDAVLVRIVHDDPLIGGLTDVKRHDIAAFDSPFRPTTFLVDALITTEHFDFAFSDTHYQDIAHFITPPGVAFRVDAIITAEKQHLFLVDANIKVPPSVEFDVDALLLGTTDFDWFADAFVSVQNQLEFDVDTVLLATIDRDYTVDAVLFIVPSELFGVDGFILGPEILFDWTVDAFLSVIKDFTFDVDARLEPIAPFLVDAILIPFDEICEVAQVQFECPPPPELAGFLVDAFLSVTLDNDFTVDATLLATINNDFLVDAIVVDIIDHTFLVDAQLQEQQFFDWTVDAILVQSIFDFTFDVDATIIFPFLNLPFTVDAQLAIRFEWDVDALLLATIDQEFLVDGHLVINSRLAHTSFIRQILNVTSFIRERRTLP